MTAGANTPAVIPRVIGMNAETVGFAPIKNCVDTGVVKTTTINKFKILINPKEGQPEYQFKIANKDSDELSNDLEKIGKGEGERPSWRTVARILSLGDNQYGLGGLICFRKTANTKANAYLSASIFEKAGIG